MGSVELDDGPMEFPEGKLNIKSTMGQIHRNPEAWAIADKMMGGKMNPEHPMWNMVENFTMEMLMGMGGDVPEAALKAINKQLNAFDLIG
jgi:beta-galactosidase